MSRDYKTRKPSTSKPEKGGSAFFGGFVGYALGIASAIAIWLYLSFGQNPFLSNEKIANTAEKNPAQSIAEAPQTPAKPAMPEEPVTVADEKPKFDFYKILPGIEEPEIDHGKRRIEKQPGQAPVIAAPPTEIANKPVEAAPQPALPRPAVAAPIETAAIQPQPIPAEPRLQPPVSPPQPQLQQPIAPPAKNTPPVKEKFFLQAGAFRSINDAENMKAQLALLGVFASIQPIDSAEKGTIYRVRIGPFDNKSDSDRTGVSLRENGIEAQLVRIQ